MKVQTSDVRAWVAAMMATGRHSPATVRKAGHVLAKVMRAAVDDGLIARSPCTGVRLPAEGSREMTFLSAAQVVELVDATDDHYRTLVATRHTSAFGGASSPASEPSASIFCAVRWPWSSS